MYKSKSLKNWKDVKVGKEWKHRLIASKGNVTVRGSEKLDTSNEC